MEPQRDLPGFGNEPRESLTLWDYRRQVSDLYAAVRQMPAQASWDQWIAERSRLLRTHEQSPVPAVQRSTHEVLTFPYDPGVRIVATVAAVAERTVRLCHSDTGETPAHAFGSVAFTLGGVACSLTLFWLDDYGGGVFAPFRDLTNGTSTYGGGRYLLDTAKGADLGGSDGQVVLDFNFAYHPSCAFDPKWSCPLAPPENRLAVAVEAGERSS
ncbi:MAG: DUF1684 domain-containing protein [Actinomycetota bacterium]